jgi:hypothetical protein
MFVIMKTFKQFSPKVDTKRRLVLTRIYTGVNGSNSFCYQISRINKRGEVDKKFKTLYAFGTDEISSVKDFYKSSTGEFVKVAKSPFKSVFGVDQKSNPKMVWNKINI